MMAADCPWLGQAAIGNVKSNFHFTLQADSKPWALCIQQLPEEGRIVPGMYCTTETVAEAELP